MQEELPNTKKASDPIVQKYHEQILTFLNTRLTETFNFYTIILAAATAFGWSLSKYVSDSILSVAYVASGILLWGGVAYILSTSYTYRNFQITLEEAEKHIGLLEITYSWRITPKLTSAWRKKLLWLTPEILRPHLYMLAFMFYLITAVYFIRLYYTGTIRNPCVASLWIEFVWAVYTAFIFWMDRRYYMKLKDKLTLKERIRRRAYELYVNGGHQHGRDRDDWRQAEDEILGGI
jgi:hypothetical protein